MRKISDSSGTTRTETLRSLDLSIGPDPIDAEIPEQDHKNSYGLGDVIAQSTPGMENQAIEAQEDGLIDDISSNADQSELDQLGKKPILPGFGERPQTVPNEVTEHGCRERAGVGPELAEPESQDQQV